MRRAALGLWDKTKKAERFVRSAPLCRGTYRFELLYTVLQTAT